ncbi:hypothetical protein B0T11DRAFT_323955 [Plectosphaerella cucumerina]|jgi:hypothetical protein|uniref:Uncharacterized protein n=1 Tax=Plectosphaerella cucumerina TaxID=40658 RepID=A0A8K0TRI1_9PEZI|nr:hypothetical protein B0T11DRAFT_323955 [Plectosphaerella cucumerina]
MRLPRFLIYLVSAPLFFSGSVLATPANDALKPAEHDAQIGLAHDHTPGDTFHLQGVPPKVPEVSSDESLPHDSKTPTCVCRQRPFLEFLVVELGPPRWVRVTFATLFVIYWIPFILNKWLDKVALVIYWYLDLPYSHPQQR